MNVSGATWNEGTWTITPALGDSNCGNLTVSPESLNISFLCCTMKGFKLFVSPCQSSFMHMVSMSLRCIEALGKCLCIHLKEFFKWFDFNVVYLLTSFIDHPSNILAKILLLGDEHHI